MTGIDSWMRAHRRGVPRVLIHWHCGYRREGIRDPIDSVGKAVVVGDHIGCHGDGVPQAL